jgi:hypothetical protein
MAGDQTVEEAREASAQTPPRLYDIILTEHGSPAEEPKGMVTLWDLMGR